MKQRWKRMLPSLLLLTALVATYLWNAGNAPAPAAQSPLSESTATVSIESTLPHTATDATDNTKRSDAVSESAATATLSQDATYTSAEDVALYLNEYGHLPDNFITKKQAEALGWEGGSLEPYAPGKSIGGSHYGNYEGTLPEQKGRKYTECDINTRGAKRRGAERIVFSNDGLIYYTADHYETFTLLYGEE